MTKLEQFFYNNAGSSYDPAIETQEQGRLRGAADLARAIRFAQEENWTWNWDADYDGCGCETPHPAEFCQLWDGDTLLASLHGICGATENYRRVVQAELALEAMEQTAKIS